MSDGIIVKNLTLSYQGHPAVHHLTGEFPLLQNTAITGPNGGGKSTLLKALGQMFSAYEGEIHYQGFSPKDLSYLPQLKSYEAHYPFSVLDVVLSGAVESFGFFASVTQQHKDMALQKLALVHAEGLENRIVSTLSPGQLQKVLMARLLMLERKVLLLDEPFTGLDHAASFDLLKLINKLRSTGYTVIAVLHDLKHIEQGFDNTLILAREAIAWGKTEQVLQVSKMREALGMLQSWSEELCEVKND